MITIIYSTHKDQEYNNKFKQHLLQNVGVKDVQILEYVNHNQYSLSSVYNSGITESIYDIVVCCHNDIKLEKNWGKKLLEDFSNNPEFGIIGKAGSCYFPESGVYWERMNLTMVGQVYHHPEGQKKWINRYSPKLPFLIPVVTIDGLFLSFDKTKIKHAFDETIGKFHFYDHLFCVPNYLDGIKIGVTSSFEITHESVGRPNQEFWESKEKFIEKWGSNLPLDLKPEYPYVPIIKTKPIKNVGKVAVIIPTKGNLELLFNCVDSLYEHCDKNMFDVFIADTGSTDDTVDVINNWMKSNGVDGQVVFEPWKDFAYNRSFAMEKIREKKYIDYILMIDADEILTYEEGLDFSKIKENLSFDLYNMNCKLGGVEYLRTSITKNKKPYFYKGVVHEYLECKEPIETRETIKGICNIPLQDSARNQNIEKYL